MGPAEDRGRPDVFSLTYATTAPAAAAMERAGGSSGFRRPCIRPHDRPRCVHRTAEDDKQGHGLRSGDRSEPSGALYVDGSDECMKSVSCCSGARAPDGAPCAEENTRATWPPSKHVWPIVIDGRHG